MKKQLFLAVLLCTGLGYCQDNQKQSAEDFFVNIARSDFSGVLTFDLFENALQDFIAQGGDVNEKIYSKSLTQKLQIADLDLNEDDLNRFRSLQVSSLLGLFMMIDLDEVVEILASKGAKTIPADIVNIAQLTGDSNQIMTVIKFLH